MVGNTPNRGVSRVTKWKETLQISAARIFPSWVVRLGIRLLKRNVVVAVGCIVVDDIGRVLLQRHTYGKPLWRLPGGLREGKETVYEAAVREVWEEAQCSVQPLAIVDAFESNHTFDIVILAHLLKIAPFEQSAEVSERAWLYPHEFPEIPPEQKQWIAEAMRLRTRLQLGD